MLKKILIFVTLLCFCPAFAIEEPDKTEYMNIPFWKHFNDNLLIDNLLMVYENNHDLKAAAYKVNEVKRLVNIFLSDELPHLGFEGYAGYTFNSSNEIYGSVVIPNYHQAHFLLPLTYNYEIDLWGKNRLKTKSQSKNLELARQDEKSVYIALTSAFANIYYNLIKTDKLIECQNELIETQTKLAECAKKRYEIGVAMLDDVIAAEKSLTYLKEELQNLLEKQDLLQNQLSVILADNSFGRVSRSKFESLNVDIKIPDAIDFKVLDSRPDRVKSELNLEKNRINIKIAKREFLPSFTITGNLGYNFYNLSSAHTFLSNLGVLPNWDLFTGGRKIAVLKLQKDRYNAAIEDYEKTVLKSIQDTNDSLYALKSGHKKHAIAKERLMHDEKELNFAFLRQDAGMANDIDLLNLYEVLLLTKKEQASLQIDEIIALIQLYQALGGNDFYGMTPQTL